jgi:hypothetical protein
MEIRPYLCDEFKLFTGGTYQLPPDAIFADAAIARFGVWGAMEQ